jgi:hypothetical protein
MNPAMALTRATVQFFGEDTVDWKEVSLVEAFNWSIIQDWIPKDCEYRGALPAGIEGPVASLRFLEGVLVVESRPGDRPRFWLGEIPFVAK